MLSRYEWVASPIRDVTLHPRQQEVATSNCAAASDVTSFAWADNGSTLYVATSEVYGTGCVYRLDLMRRKAECNYLSLATIPSALESERFAHGES